MLTFFSKCTKWVPGKKSALGDKMAIKRHTNFITWDRIPYIHSPIVSSEDVFFRKKQVRLIIRDFILSQSNELSSFMSGKRMALLVNQYQMLRFLESFLGASCG